MIYCTTGEWACLTVYAILAYLLTCTTERLDEQIRLFDSGDVIGAYNFWVSNTLLKSIYQAINVFFYSGLTMRFLKWVNELLVAIDA